MTQLITSPTLAVRPIAGLRFTSTFTLRALVTLSPELSLSYPPGYAFGGVRSSGRGGSRIPADFRAELSFMLVSNDVTDVTESRG